MKNEKWIRIVEDINRNFELDLIFVQKGEDGRPIKRLRIVKYPDTPKGKYQVFLIRKVAQIDEFHIEIEQDEFIATMDEIEKKVKIDLDAFSIIHDINDLY